MKTLLLIALTCLCLLAAPCAHAQKPTTKPQSAPTFAAFWAKFQSAVAQNDKEAVAAMTRFPLTMPYGVPSIKTKAQFLQRYAKIFDAATRKCFATAQPERENNKSARYNVLCGEAMLYEFDLVGGTYKFVTVDNINE
jgi:hypothetical protein